jgi:hypothetical protein
MQVLTINELMRLTRIELCALAAKIRSALPNYPAGSVEQQNALITLQNIRFVLSRREPTP